MTDLDVPSLLSFHDRPSEGVVVLKERVESLLVRQVDRDPTPEEE